MKCATHFSSMWSDLCAKCSVCSRYQQITTENNETLAETSFRTLGVLQRSTVPHHICEVRERTWGDANALDAPAAHADALGWRDVLTGNVNFPQPGNCFRPANFLPSSAVVGHC